MDRNLHVNLLQLFRDSLTLLVPQGIRGPTERRNKQFALLKKSSRRMKTVTLVF